jgi:pimeloyl-ACP methyl ester carboxylesterase
MRVTMPCAEYGIGRHIFQRQTEHIMAELWRLSATQLARLIRTREVSAREAAEAALDRLDAVNPDHVAIVIHNYRWRIGLAEGEPQYDALEQRLAEAPVITVPTITLEGSDNGAPHPEAAAYRQNFSGRYEYRLIQGGAGHNLPQEAPQAFADAVVAVDRF